MLAVTFTVSFTVTHTVTFTLTFNVVFIVNCRYIYHYIFLPYVFL